ncbi:MAG: Arm DNA-binding domain-containing protein [Rudaea sp.]
MMLTDTAVRQARLAEKAHKLFDGCGWYLLILPAGGKYCRVKYALAGGVIGVDVLAPAAGRSRHDVSDRAVCFPKMFHPAERLGILCLTPTRWRQGLRPTGILRQAQGRLRPALRQNGTVGFLIGTLARGAIFAAPRIKSSRS